MAKFGLRTVFGLILAICVACAVAIPILGDRAASKEHALAARLRQQGFDVETRGEPSGLPRPRGRERSRVVSVSVPPDEALGLLIVETGTVLPGSDAKSRTPGSRKKLNKSAFGKLETLSRLTSVDFAFSDCGDEDIGALSNIPNLANLNVSFSEVTDAGLLHLSRSRTLRFLRVAGTRVTDSGLRELPPLEVLDVSDSSCCDVRRWPVGQETTSVSCRNTRVTDEQLRLLLERCPRLRELDLRGSRVSDNSIQQLLAAPSLASVRVNGCRLVSSKGARTLAKSQRLDSDSEEWAAQLDALSAIRRTATFITN